MAKRVDLSLTIDLPSNHEADRVTVTPDGRVRIFDKSGKEVVPARVERATHYERTKGRKFQARANIDRNYASVGGLEELARLDSFVVIDTNSAEVDGTRVSVAYFIVCKLIPEKDGFRLTSLDNRGHAYEFHDVPGNPEMLAILKVAHDTMRGRGALGESRIGVITDSELGSHQAISCREMAIYGEQYLPQGFALMYASADTGQELTNRLIKVCDAQATKYLYRLKDGTFRRTGLARLEEDPAVVFRYTYYPDFKITNSIVTGATITPETKWSIQFSGEPEV
ncbi:MAG: hypothetical protein AABM64_14435 [Pseudomonadota bacterium]